MGLGRVESTVRLRLPGWMPLGQCLRRYVLSYARASDEL